jgi:hypothetical protein
MAKLILSNMKDSFVEIESEGTLHELLGLLHMAEIELRCRVIGIIKAREEKFAEQIAEPDQNSGQGN